MTLAVGHITYANCAPFFHYLPDVGFTGRIFPGVPTELNAMLASGAIDVSPSSSIEYARNWSDYLLLPGHSISACGPVRSVLLFTPSGIAEIEGEEIALSGESATSVALLEILLREYYGHRELRCAVPAGPVEEAVASGRPTLLIGDRALKAAMHREGAGCVHDLGEIWHRFTGLPFVFALWIVRREATVLKRDELLRLQRNLDDSRARAFDSLEELAARTPERRWLGEEELVAYWRCMSYDLSATHLEGLRLFFRLAVKYGLLTEFPEIRFFE